MGGRSPFISSQSAEQTWTCDQTNLDVLSDTRSNSLIPVSTPLSKRSHRNTQEWTTVYLSSEGAQFRRVFPFARGTHLCSYGLDPGGATPHHQTAPPPAWSRKCGDLHRRNRRRLEAVRGTFFYSAIASSFNFIHLFGKITAKTLYSTISTSMKCQAAPSCPSSHCKSPL